MKAANYEAGRKYAGRLTRGIEGVEADIVVTDCQLSGQRILQENGVRPVHPVEALAHGYGVAISVDGGEER
jgi:glycerol-3-phosphate dehydrogenase subunit C